MDGMLNASTAGVNAAYARIKALERQIKEIESGVNTNGTDIESLRDELAQLKEEHKASVSTENATVGSLDVTSSAHLRSGLTVHGESGINMEDGGPITTGGKVTAGSVESLNGIEAKTASIGTASISTASMNGLNADSAVLGTMKANQVEVKDSLEVGRNYSSPFGDNTVTRLYKNTAVYGDMTFNSDTGLSQLQGDYLDIQARSMTLKEDLAVEGSISTDKVIRTKGIENDGDITSTGSFVNKGSFRNEGSMDIRDATLHNTMETDTTVDGLTLMNLEDAGASRTALDVNDEGKVVRVDLGDGGIANSLETVGRVEENLPVVTEGSDQNAVSKTQAKTVANSNNDNLTGYFFRRDEEGKSYDIYDITGYYRYDLSTDKLTKVVTITDPTQKTLLMAPDVENYPNRFLYIDNLTHEIKNEKHEIVAGDVEFKMNRDFRTGPYAIYKSSKGLHIVKYEPATNTITIKDVEWDADITGAFTAADITNYFMVYGDKNLSDFAVVMTLRNNLNVFINRYDRDGELVRYTGAGAVDTANGDGTHKATLPADITAANINSTFFTSINEPYISGDTVTDRSETINVNPFLLRIGAADWFELKATDTYEYSFSKVDMPILVSDLNVRREGLTLQQFVYAVVIENGRFSNAQCMYDGTSIAVSGEESGFEDISGNIRMCGFLANKAGYRGLGAVGYRLFTSDAYTAFSNIKMNENGAEFTDTSITLSGTPITLKDNTLKINSDVKLKYQDRLATIENTGNINGVGMLFGAAPDGTDAVRLGRTAENSDGNALSITKLNDEESTETTLNSNGSVTINTQSFAAKTGSSATATGIAFNTAGVDIKSGTASLSVSPVSFDLVKDASSHIKMTADNTLDIKSSNITSNKTRTDISSANGSLRIGGEYDNTEEGSAISLTVPTQQYLTMGDLANDFDMLKIYRGMCQGDQSQGSYVELATNKLQLMNADTARTPFFTYDDKGTIQMKASGNGYDYSADSASVTLGQTGKSAAVTGDSITLQGAATFTDNVTINGQSVNINSDVTIPDNKTTTLGSLVSNNGIFINKYSPSKRVNKTPGLYHFILIGDGFINGNDVGAISTRGLHIINTTATAVSIISYTAGGQSSATKDVAMTYINYNGLLIELN